MEFIVLSDLHIHNYAKKIADEESRLNNCLDVLVKAFAEANSKDKIILFSGDLYDQEKQIPTEVINKTVLVFRNLFSWYSEVKFIAISGNHDHATKNTLDHKAISALEHLNYVFTNFILLDNTSIIIEGQEIVGVPYYKHKEHFQDAISKINNPSDKILLMHQTNIAGVIPGDFSTPDVAKFKFVFNGHIHKHERLSQNVVNVGSPLYRDHGDKGDKGYLVYNTESNDFIFHPLDYPKLQELEEAAPIWDAETQEVTDETFSLVKTDKELIQAYATKQALEPKFIDYLNNL